MFRQDKLFLLIILIAIVALAITSCGSAEKGVMHSEVYTVQSGDTLWNISAKYMEKNTYGPRDIREFYHGIIENNYDSVFKNRKPGEIFPGDKLIITWWEK